MSDRLIEINTAIYSRTVSENFSEQFASYSSTRLGKDISEVRIITSTHEGAIAQVRIDFSRFPIAFYLDSLTISQPNGASVFIFTPDYDWRNNSADMKVARTRDGVLIECLSNESSLLIPIPEAISSNTLVVSFAVRGIFGTEDASKVDTAEVRALNYLLAEQEDLSRYVGNLLRNHEAEWQNARSELAEINKKWDISGISLADIKNSQHEIYMAVQKLEKISDNSIKSIINTYDDYNKNLNKKIDKIAEELSLSNKNSVKVQSHIQERHDKSDSLLLEFKDNLSKSVVMISDQTDKVESLERASDLSLQQINALGTQLESQQSTTIGFFESFTVKASEANAEQLRLTHQESSEQKLYVRTGINAIRRDIERSNALPDVRRLGLTVDIQSRAQTDLLHNIFDSLSYVKHSKGMNIKLAARIMAANYRYKNAESLTKEAHDFEGARVLIDELRQELLETRSMVEVVLRSWSWYLTKPLRFASRLFGRLLRSFSRN